MLISRAQKIGFAGGVICGLLVLAGIFLGSGNLTRFDSPLAAYAAATVFAAFAMAYRYLMWIQRPPTWRYFTASIRLFLRPRSLVRNIWRMVGLLWSNIVIQKFIGKRSHSRWMAHMCLAWGCLIAFFITFPLSWGWLQFGVAPNGHDYRVVLFGIETVSFPPSSMIGFMMFNGLNISAVMVITGVFLAMQRRIYGQDAQAVQSLAADFMPLFLLFAVAVTGLMLTASYRVMGGSHFSFLSLLHAFTVILLLLYMPFGKLFHVIQRPAQLGVAYYKEEGERTEQATCSRSGLPYQSKLHHDDLVEVMKELDLDFGAHQNLSPEEKRKIIAISQLEALEGRSFVG